MRLLLIGAPGAGKGTQAVRIAEMLGLQHLSSGDLLRRHMADGTSIGRRAREYVERGDLVPDAIVLDMLYKPVSAASRAGGYVLDGFPRTVEQAETAYSVARGLGTSVQTAIHLWVPEDDLVTRLVARGRGDDTEEVIRHRLAVYQEKTLPLLDYYAAREQLVTVNGGRPVNEVTWSIEVQIRAANKRAAKARAKAEKAQGR